jgi:hypothetical protein
MIWYDRSGNHLSPVNTQCNHSAGSDCSPAITCILARTTNQITVEVIKTVFLHNAIWLNIQFVLIILIANQYGLHNKVCKLRLRGRRHYPTCIDGSNQSE